MLEGFLGGMDILYIGIMRVCRSKLTINNRHFYKLNRKGLGISVYFNSIKKLSHNNINTRELREN